MTLHLDPYGIGAAQFMALDLYENASSASGRSTMLLDAVKPGDHIYVPDSTISKLYRIALQERGMKVRTDARGHRSDEVAILVVFGDRPLRDIPENRHGRTLLSHDYVLSVYRHSLRSAAKSLNALAEHMSKRADYTRRLPRAENPFYTGSRMNEIAYGKHPL